MSSCLRTHTIFHLFKMWEDSLFSILQFSYIFFVMPMCFIVSVINGIFSSIINCKQMFIHRKTADF